MSENIENNIPSQMDLFWIESIKGLSKDSLRSMEEGAKGLLTACSLLVTVYIYIISNYLNSQNHFEFSSIVLFCLPIFFFILSIFSSIMVLYPSKYQVNLYSPLQCKKTLEKIGRRNCRWMRWALILLIFGSMTLTIVIALALLNAELLFLSQ